jgi:hypothetical protein
VSEAPILPSLYPVVETSISGGFAVSARIENTSQSTDEFPPPRRLYKVKAHNKDVGTMMLKDGAEPVQVI